jgi:hypothetical protein
VAYDLIKPEKDYPDLTKTLESYPNHYHCQRSVWMISTNETSDQITEKLKKSIDGNDHILIISVGKDGQGWMPGEFWTWYNRNK